MVISVVEVIVWSHLKLRWLLVVWSCGNDWVVWHSCCISHKRIFHRQWNSVNLKLLVSKYFHLWVDEEVEYCNTQNIVECCNTQNIGDASMAGKIGLR